MASNLYVLPAYGKPISLDDQGIYYVLNQKTGAIQTVVQVVYQQNDWYLFQLQPTSMEDEFCWTVMSDDAHCQLESMTSCQIAKHFSKPQFSEPKGAWQVINNGKYGFGKFTPLESEQPIGYAVIVFDADGIRSVIRLHREEASANAVMHQQVAYPHVEFA